MNNYYGVFCIASQLNEERNLDVIWETAIKLYDEFLVSEYNDHNESELECINRFMSRAK
jgi:hypothetical protein